MKNVDKKLIIDLYLSDNYYIKEICEIAHCSTYMYKKIIREYEGKIKNGR